MRLKELRKSRGISQLKLAMDLNMNQNSISRYENGEREADYAGSPIISTCPSITFSGGRTTRK